MYDVVILGMGYLGRPLAQRLSAAGMRVDATRSRVDGADQALPWRVQPFDLQHFQAAHPALAGWETAATWVCLLPPSCCDDYVARLGEWLAWARACGVAHVVYSSSISVYGDAVRVCDEHSAPDPQTESARRVWAAEQAFVHSGVPHVSILRLGGLYSAIRHPLHSLLKRQNHPGAQQPVNMIGQDAAVNALQRAIATPAGIRIRNIVEAGHPSKQAFYAAEAKCLGLPEPSFDPNDMRGGKMVHSLYRDED